jgi:S1-C subfamily serine protease
LAIVARTALIACAVAVISMAVIARGDGPAGASAPPDLQQRINLAVVAIDALVGGDSMHSSGAVIDADRGLVLTSNRAVWGATSLRVGTGLGLVYGRILARAPCNDLALVQLEPQLPGLVALPRATAPPAPGQLLTAVGRRRANPDLGPDSLLKIPALRAVAGGSNRISLDAPLLPESTGGPIVDPNGRLVGMVVTGSANDAAAPTRAMASPAIEKRLSELKPGPRAVYVGWRSQYRCAAQLNAATKAAHPAFEVRDAWINAPVPATRVPGAGGVDGG